MIKIETSRVFKPYNFFFFFSFTSFSSFVLLTVDYFKLYLTLSSSVKRQWWLFRPYVTPNLREITSCNEYVMWKMPLTLRLSKVIKVYFVLESQPALAPSSAIYGIRSTCSVENCLSWESEDVEARSPGARCVCTVQRKRRKTLLFCTQLKKQENYAS